MRCRLCLIECTSQSALSLFKKNDEINFIDLIVKYFSFEIKPDDSYSTVICQNCSRQLKDFDNFWIYIKRCQYALEAVAKRRQSANGTDQTRDKPPFECLLFVKKDVDDDEIGSEIERADNSDSGEYNEVNEKYDDDYVHENEADENEEDVNEEGDIEEDNNDDGHLNEEIEEINDEVDSKNEESNNTFANYESSAEDMDCSVETLKKDPEIERILDFDEFDDRTCVVCHKVFKNYYVLKGHMYRSHREKIPFTCKICENKFRSKRALRHHLVKVHKYQLPKSKRLLLEKLKEDRMKKLAEKKENQNLENDDHNYCNANDSKPNVDDLENRTCPVCHKVLKNFMVLKTHMILVHKNIKLFSCTFCGQKFRLNRYLKYHLKVDKKCSKLVTVNAPVKHVLKQHQAAHPLADLPLLNRTCAVCEKEFKSVATLKSHMHSSHYGIKPYGCDFCGNKFALRPSLQRHLLKDQKCSEIKLKMPAGSTKQIGVNENDEENRKCAVCETMFQNIVLLRTHMFKKHKDSKPFTCNICGLQFRLRLSLQRHLFRDTKCSPGNPAIRPHRKETDPGPLDERTCGICEQICKNPHALKTHMCFRHKGMKPFSCDYCELKFAMKRSWSRHLKRVHYDMIPPENVTNVEQTMNLKQENDSDEIEVSWSFEVQDTADFEEQEISLEGSDMEVDYSNLDSDALTF